MTSIEAEVIELYESIVAGSLRCFPKHFWSGSEAKEYAAILTRYLLNKTNTDPRKATKNTFQKNKLSSILHLFGNSTYGVIENAFPGQYKPWQLRQTPVDYWTGPNSLDNAAYAVRWLIEERLGWNVDDIPMNLEYRTFHKHDLGGMIQIAFVDSIFDAVDNAYPGRFEPWEFRRLKLDWTPELSAEALRWLVFEKLKITPQEAISVVTYDLIVDYNLITPYRAFNFSIEQFFINAFPELKDSYADLKGGWLKDIAIEKAAEMNRRRKAS